MHPCCCLLHILLSTLDFAMVSREIPQTTCFSGVTSPLSVGGLKKKKEKKDWSNQEHLLSVEAAINWSNQSILYTSTIIGTGTIFTEDGLICIIWLYLLRRLIYISKHDDVFNCIIDPFFLEWNLGLYLYLVKSVIRINWTSQRWAND